MLRRRLGWLALAPCLAACPSDPTFQASDSQASDTSGDVAADSAEADSAEADTSAVDADVADAANDADSDVACVPGCAPIMATGGCGTDPCGGACYCASASTCASEACACVDDCDASLVGDLMPLIAAATDVHGQPIVVGFRQPFPSQTDLVLRRFDGVGWKRETAAEGVATPLLVAAGVTDDDEIDVLFQTHDALAGAVIWAHRPLAVERAWASEPFLGLVDASRPLVVVSASGEVVASAVTLDDFTLHIARRDPHVGWEQLAEYGPVGFMQNLLPVVLTFSWTLDRDDRPHMVSNCCNTTEPELLYRYWNGRDWVEHSFGVQPNTSVNPGRKVAIGIDDDDHPHILVQTADQGIGVVRELHWDGMKWLSEELDRGAVADARLGQSLELEVDRRHRFHVIYQDDTRLNYRRWDGARWSDELLAPLPNRSDSLVDLTVDRADRAHVAFVGDDGAVHWWTPAPR
ncbi:MAG: hypothetical protein U1F43_03865 [Myxococcota bacterium]